MASLTLLVALLTVFGSAAGLDLKWMPIWPSLKLENTTSGASKHWVVLVAGSNGWFNYRHQADICHAYQIVKGHGVPEDQIITMMYDDIAHNTMNPTKGIIINKPDGSNVYAGVKIDYKADDVTPHNFLGVLNGTGRGKVLKSGPNDFVFVNFVDHGATGIIGFPNDILAAKPLIDALNYMHEKKMYRKLVFYLEACESGSMFEGLLPPGASIYATTASNALESSYACYYDKKRETYLGDFYSVNWMEDTDVKDVNLETLEEQFAVVKAKTNTSTVMKYGDLSLGQDKVGEFQGSLDTQPAVTVNSMNTHATDVVSQRDAQMSILMKRLASAKYEVDRINLTFLIRQLGKKRDEVANVFYEITEKSLKDIYLTNFLTTIRYPLTNLDCHHSVVNEIHKQCFNLGRTEQALSHIYLVVNLCELGIGTDTIIAAVREVCGLHRLAKDL